MTRAHRLGAPLRRVPPSPRDRSSAFLGGETWWILVCAALAVVACGSESQGATAATDAEAADQVSNTDLGSPPVDAPQVQDSGAGDTVGGDSGAEDSSGGEPDICEPQGLECPGGATCSLGVVQRLTHEVVTSCTMPDPGVCVAETGTCEFGCRKAAIGLGAALSCDDGHMPACLAAVCAPDSPTGPLCADSEGYMPYTLDEAVDDLLDGSHVECGCVRQDLGVDPEANACLCDAWATCTPARLRVLMPGPSGGFRATDVLVRPNGLGGCRLERVKDQTQEALVMAEAVEHTQCEDLLCPADDAPAPVGCGPVQPCPPPPVCDGLRTLVDTDGDDCGDACCITECPTDFVVADYDDDGCGDACGDAPCASPGDCSLYPCVFTQGQCADPKGICTIACDFSGPVCGCDGKTYETGCAANAAGVAVETSGSCGT